MPRAMWSGAINFGLVNIPVKLFKATASSSGKQISFHQIHKPCGTRLRHIRWCPKDEVEVPWDEAYALLHETLAKSGKVAVARVLLRTRSHLALVRVLADHLVLETMYFDAEIIDAAEIPGLPHGKAARSSSRWRRRRPRAARRWSIYSTR